MSRLCSTRCDYWPTCPCGGRLPNGAAYSDQPPPPAGPPGRWALFAPDERQVLEVAVLRLVDRLGAGVTVTQTGRLEPAADASTLTVARRLADQLRAAARRTSPSTGAPPPPAV